MIKTLFKPKTYIRSVYELNLEALVKDGYKLLLCDIDNTLVGFKEQVPPTRAMEFFMSCHKLGIKLILVSNNNEKRVVPFADAAGVECTFFSLKPLKGTYKKILKETGYNAKETACVGDQIITDVLGGNRMNIHTIFCDRIVDSDSIQTKINRTVESVILKILTAQNEFKQGEYYGYKM